MKALNNFLEKKKKTWNHKLLYNFFAVSVIQQSVSDEKKKMICSYAESWQKIV